MIYRLRTLFTTCLIILFQMSYLDDYVVSDPLSLLEKIHPYQVERLIILKLNKATFTVAFFRHYADEYPEDHNAKI